MAGLILPVPGGSLRPVGSIMAHAAAWAPDGQYIVYARIPLVHVRCRRHRFAGTDQGFRSSFCAPLFSRWPPLALHDSGHNQRTSSLWEVSADGKDLHPVLPNWNKPAQEFGGAWTPNGDYFLFESTRDHTQNIWALHEVTSWFRKADRRTDPADGRAAYVQQSDAKPGWEEAICDWAAAPVRFDPHGSKITAVLRSTFPASRRARRMSSAAASGSLM